MTTTYTIIFENNRRVSGKYAVFTEPPKVAPVATVYSNVWMSYNVQVGGTFTINTSVDYYAWVGTAPTTPAPGITVSTADRLPVVLGTTTAKGTTYPMVVREGEVSLQADAETRTALPGAFEIDTGFDFTVPNTTYLIGMGKVGKGGRVAPCATLLANNNTQTNITPIVKFYIGESAYTPGTVVNFSQASLQAAAIDFTSPDALGKLTAVVAHQPDGRFVVTYENSDSTAMILAKTAAKNKKLAGMADGAKLRELQSHITGLSNILHRLGLDDLQGTDEVEYKQKSNGIEKANGHLSVGASY